MTYPQEAGFQAHSSTSREAAAQLTSAANMRDCFYREIKSQYRYGCTGDELAAKYGVVNGTVAARLVELEAKGKVIRTDYARQTRSNRKAYVYVCPEYWTEGMGKRSTRRYKSVSDDHDAARELAEEFIGLIVRYKDDNGGASLRISPIDAHILINKAQAAGIL